MRNEKISSNLLQFFFFCGEGVIYSVNGVVRFLLNFLFPALVIVLRKTFLLGDPRSSNSLLDVAR